MLNGITRIAVAVMCCAAISVCALPAQTQRSIANVRAEILRVAAQQDSISRQGDADANAALYTEDAVVSLGGVDDIRGRDALRTSMRHFYEANVVQQHRLELLELEVYGDTAYARGIYLFVAGPRGQAAVRERGRYAAMWRRGDDGAWRIHRYFENLLPTAPSK